MATQCPLPRYRQVRGITLQAARTTSLADRHVLLQSVAVTADHTAKRLTSANGESYESVWAPDLKQGASGVSRTSVVGSPGSDSTVGLGAAQRRLRRPTTSRRHEEAILKDIVELAARYDTPIRTALRLDIAPEDAILRQARLGRYDLVVMGVGRPAGKTLYFGKIAAAVLENSEHSILFVSS